MAEPNDTKPNPALQESLAKMKAEQAARPPDQSLANITRIGVQGGIDFSQEEMVQQAVSILKRTTCKACPDSEIALVLYMCARYGFDPLMKEIGFIAGQGPWISRDARLRKATQEPDYAGLDSLPIRNEAGKLVAWRCIGYKWRRDNRIPVVTIEHTLEYWEKPRWSEGQNNAEAMIQKVAEDRCFERMYPISGIRTDTQMAPPELPETPSITVQPMEYKPLEEPKKG